MNRRLPLLWLFILLVASGVAAAAPGSFRCGNDLVLEGDVRSRVRVKCGEPTEVSHSVAWRSPVYWHHGYPYHLGGSVREVPVEVWTYNRGPNSFMRRLRFEDGVLIEIETLGYGY